MAKGSENVFADLGFPDAELHLVKAELVRRIQERVDELGLKQAEAAKRIGLTQPDVSRLLDGQFRRFSIERLVRFLTALGQDVQIAVKPAKRQQVTGSLTIA